MFSWDTHGKNVGAKTHCDELLIILVDVFELALRVGFDIAIVLVAGDAHDGVFRQPYIGRMFWLA